MCYNFFEVNICKYFDEEVDVYSQQEVNEEFICVFPTVSLLKDCCVLIHGALLLIILMELKIWVVPLKTAIKQK